MGIQCHLRIFYLNSSDSYYVFQVMSIMSMWTRLQPAYAANMWNEALNKRLGTEVHQITAVHNCPSCALGHVELSVIDILQVDSMYT